MDGKLIRLLLPVLKRLIPAVGCCLVAGCAPKCVATTPPPPVCHRYQAPGLDWALIRRILLVPLENDSPYPQGTNDLREALAARLQLSGRFEIVLTGPDTRIACRDAVRLNGRFDEGELIELAEAYNADAILFGSITQYQPYTPPRVGLSLRLISPTSGSLISSVDGLWDAREGSVADQARAYTAYVLNDGRSLNGCDLALESPAIFRRFACQQAAEALLYPVQLPPTEGSATQPASGFETSTPPQSIPPYPAPYLPPLEPAPPLPGQDPLSMPPALPGVPFDPSEPAVPILPPQTP